MLNTIMALWNQDPAKSKHKMFKSLLTLLFISMSMFLLLFTLNGSIFSLFAGREQHLVKSDTSMYSAASPGGDVGTIGITPTPTPTPTPTSTTISVQSCMLTPTVVAIQKVFIAPRTEATHVIKRSVKNNTQKYVRPKSIVSKKEKPQHSKKTPQVKATATPTLQPTEIAPTLPVETATVQETTPTATATNVPTSSATVIGNTQDIRVLPMTEATSATPTASFEEHIRNKSVTLISNSQQSKITHEEIRCSTPIPGGKGQIGVGASPLRAPASPSRILARAGRTQR